MLGITEYYLGFGFQKRSTRFPPGQSFTLSSTRVQRGRFARFTGHRSGNAPSGPDCAVGARLGPDRARLRRRAPIGAGLSRAVSTVPSWHGLVLLDTKKPALSYNMWLGLVGARLRHDCVVGPRSGPDCTVGPRSGPIALSGPDRAPIAPSGPDRAPIAPPRSGPDCAVGPRSGRNCAVTVGDIA